MGVFLATLAVFGVCCLLLALGLIVDRRELKGGCGHKPEGSPRCEDCPGRKNDEGACQS